MRARPRPVLLVVSLAFLGALPAGCATQLRNRELESVAKDWCLVLRASQVIPVYPLTEDLQPGDLFLVQMPVDRQHEAYLKKGFLSLENHLARLEPTGYRDFYQHSFPTSEGEPLPLAWLSTGWSKAPTVTFPTYSFSARSGAGLSLALPVQGVPVALSLLGGGEAEGSVTIRDARTYGVDMLSLQDDVLRWEKERQGFLSRYEPHDEVQSYLRVITRVFLARRLSVEAHAAGSAAGKISAGAEKPVDLVVPRAGAEPDKAAMESYRENLDALNKIIAAAAGAAEGAIPGGTLKVVAASARSVTLDETFPRPLVIGYLGFDMAIGPHGALGAPVPTLAVLDGGIAPAPVDLVLTASALRTAYAAWKDRKAAGEGPATAMVQDLDALAALIPESYPVAIHGLRDAGGPLDAIFKAGAPTAGGVKDFTRITSYLGQLQASIDALEKARKDRNVSVAGFESRGAEAEAYLAEQLRLARAAREEALHRLKREAALLQRALSSAIGF